MTNCHTWFGRGGKAAAGGCTGEVINKSHLVPPVLELGADAG